MVPRGSSKKPLPGIFGRRLAAAKTALLSTRPTSNQTTHWLRRHERSHQRARSGDSRSGPVVYLLAAAIGDLHNGRHRQARLFVASRQRVRRDPPAMLAKLHTFSLLGIE